MITRARMLMYGKEASNRKQEIDRQHYTIPNQRPSSTDKIDISAVKPVNTGFFRVLRAKKRVKKP